MGETGKKWKGFDSWINPDYQMLAKEGGGRGKKVGSHKYSKKESKYHIETLNNFRHLIERLRQTYKRRNKTVTLHRGQVKLHRMLWEKYGKKLGNMSGKASYRRYSCKTIFFHDFVMLQYMCVMVHTGHGTLKRITREFLVLCTCSWGLGMNTDEVLWGLSHKNTALHNEG